MGLILTSNNLKCHGPLLSMISLSLVLVTWGQPKSENITWKIPEKIHEF